MNRPPLSTNSPDHGNVVYVSGYGQNKRRDLGGPWFQANVANNSDAEIAHIRQGGSRHQLSTIFASASNPQSPPSPQIQSMIERQFVAKRAPAGDADAQFALAVGKERFKLRIASETFGHVRHL